jgi:hypothetical protein
MPIWLRIMAFASSTMLKDSTSSEIVVPAIVLIKISNCEPDSNSPKNQTPRDTAASNTVRGSRGMGSALSVTIHMDICEVSRHARFKRRLTNDQFDHDPDPSPPWTFSCTVPGVHRARV